VSVSVGTLRRCVSICGDIETLCQYLWGHCDVVSVSVGTLRRCVSICVLNFTVYKCIWVQNMVWIAMERLEVECKEGCVDQ
jgi:hypothetical protein